MVSALLCLFAFMDFPAVLAIRGFLPVCPFSRCVQFWIFFFDPAVSALLFLFAFMDFPAVLAMSLIFDGWLFNVDVVLELVTSVGNFSCLFLL